VAAKRREERERERERGGGEGEYSLTKERVRDKIASNELSGPDVCLMRTAEIISTRGEDTGDSACDDTCASSSSLFSRDGERTRLCFRWLEMLEDFSPVISLSFLNTLMSQGL